MIQVRMIMYEREERGGASWAKVGDPEENLGSRAAKDLVPTP